MAIIHHVDERELVKKTNLLLGIQIKKYANYAFPNDLIKSSALEIWGEDCGFHYKLKALVWRQISLFPWTVKENAELCVSFYTSEWLPVPTCVIPSLEKMSERYYLTNSTGVQEHLTPVIRTVMFHRADRPLACNLQCLKEVGKGEEKPSPPHWPCWHSAGSSGVGSFSLSLLFVKGKKSHNRVLLNTVRRNFCHLEEIYWLTEVFPIKLYHCNITDGDRANHKISFLKRIMSPVAWISISEQHYENVFRCLFQFELCFLIFCFCCCYICVGNELTS